MGKMFKIVFKDGRIRGVPPPDYFTLEPGRVIVKSGICQFRTRFTKRVLQEGHTKTMRVQPPMLCYEDNWDIPLKNIKNLSDVLTALELSPTEIAFWRKQIAVFDENFEVTALDYRTNLPKEEAEKPLRNFEKKLKQSDLNPETYIVEEVGASQTFTGKYFGIIY